MSASTEPEAAQAADAHDDDEPINELLPGEPHTPMWLPLLGGILALLALLAFLVTRPPGRTAKQLSKQAAPQASAVPAPSASAAPAGNAPGAPPNPAVPMPAPRPAAPNPGGG